MLDTLNQYSNLLIAIAALISAFFASVIWSETRKYRQITNELKELNKRIIEKDEPNIWIEVPSEVKVDYAGLNKATFFIPISFLNLSNRPNSIFYLAVKVNGEIRKLFYRTKDELDNLPLDQSINLNPWSVSYIYLAYEMSIKVDQKLFPTVQLDFLYTHLDRIEHAFSVKYQIDKIGDDFCLIRIKPDYK